MKIRRENLMIVAGIIWMVAGVNVTIVGLQAFLGQSFGGWVLAALILGSIAVAILFHMMFGRIVRKQVTRIRSYKEDRQSVLRFFDRRGYIMMVAMSSVGITLRAFGLVPGWFVAFFYTGLGVALAFAGFGFVLYRFMGADWRPHARHRRIKPAA